MRLLLSNDDGVFSPGMLALAQVLSGEHELFVAAPDSERSCVSRGMTLFSPLRAQRVTLPGLADVPAYAISGTPVDCVRLALGNLMAAPDMVISGINIGGNLGTDVLYSGTVAAAAEASLLGYQAVAVSICSFRPEHLETAAHFAKKAVSYVQENPLPFGTVLNVNVPDREMDKLSGVMLAPAGVVQYTLPFIERADPSGMPYYWPPRGRSTCDNSLEVDERYALEGYVTVTPLTYDLTHHGLMRKMDVSDWVG